MEPEYCVQLCLCTQMFPNATPILMGSIKGPCPLNHGFGMEEASGASEMTDRIVSSIHSISGQVHMARHYWHQ